ncbi:MAG: hypothetical protein HXN66_02020 [Prevotella pallens]|uniref:hypothetical protein n=1 Tax=Prevotella pallens TaxID=60133 RepID=UPI001CABDE39|nr:hypothetical protein [Prevotella pallens]MBF1470184.1 hypothetical protein [Prevotella pallens]MBF1524947.1 hypothetical protein [Prevotella pallens]
MMKKLRLIQLVLLFLFTIGAYSAGPISGYFRIKNAYTRADKKQYVQVTGKYRAQPNQTAEAVKTQPGSVIQLDAEWDNTKNIYTIKTLRSQGVDVINGYLLKGIAMVKDKIYAKLKEKLTILAPLAMVYLETQVLNKWDLDMHLEKTTTTNGAEAYYAYATVPSMQPIVDFYNNNGNLVKSGIESALANYPDIRDGLKHNNADEVWEAVEKYAVQALEGRFGTSSDLVILVKSYVDAGRVNHGHTYYLMEGALDRVTENGNAVNKYREGEAKFNFCNNNATAWFGPELPAVGEAAKWIIEPVGENSNNYFGVTTADKMKGKNNKYFTTLYTDFPMKIIDNINAYVVESVGTIGEEKGYAKCTKIASQGEIIPAQTPIILELETTQSNANRLLPIASSNTIATNNILKAIFFDEAKTTVETNGKTIRVFNINPNTSVRNPLGFYRYRGTTVKGNKAFLLVDANTSGAKLDGYDMENEETTAGIEEVATPKTNNEAVYYDLQGRRVEKPNRGIYIVNGKKVIIK